MLHDQVRRHTIVAAAFSFGGGGLRPDKESMGRPGSCSRVVGGLARRGECVSIVRVVEVYCEGRASAPGDAAQPLVAGVVPPGNPLARGERLGPFRKGPDFVWCPGGDDVLGH